MSGDLDLVRRYLAGDREAADLVGKRLACVGRMVRSRARQLFGGLPEHELEDLTQAVVTKILASLPKYEGRAALESWAFAYCEGELRNAGRRRRRERGLHGDDETLREEPAPPPPETFEDLLACLDRLGDRERRLVRAKHYDELRLEDLAKRADAGLNTIKSRYYRALLQLRQCLERREGEEGESR